MAMMSDRGCWSAVLALLVLAGGALAAPPRFRNAEYFVSTECTYGWLRFELENPNPQPLDCRLEVHGYGGREPLVELRGQSLAPGEVRLFQWPVPVLLRYNNVTVSVYSREGEDRTPANAPRDCRFLHLAPVRQWSAEQHLIDFSNLNPSPAYTHASPGGHIVVQRDPAEGLPDNWLCYLPFRAVFAQEAAWNRLAPGERGAILDWVGAGGELVVYGASEPRQERRLLGLIRHQREHPLEGTPASFSPRRAAVDAFRQAHSGAVQSAFPYASRDYGERAGGLLLATAYLILAGPVNYMYWRRKRRMRMLIVSVPAIAGAFCLAIGLFFIATQGFARKGGSYSITAIDERADAGFTFSRHALYSGLYPAGGFGFDARTCFYPLRDPDYGESYGFDYRDGHRLTRGLFKPSVNFQYFTARPIQTRERLEYDRAAGTVLNGHAGDLRGLLLRDGGRLLWARTAPSGRKVALEEVSEPTARLSGLFAERALAPKDRPYWDHMRSFTQPILEDTAAPVYLALLGRDPEALEQGAPIRGGGRCNVLVGILEER